ncbi:hypothetical protein [Streptomyces albicerus]|uniref:hypothetical protein n=1 Tax=Streptomyces albicerus TaxID=2569859 RepID=UPI00124B3E82|nr:hypothetical protein [Streptomyces albicerus]
MITDEDIEQAEARVTKTRERGHDAKMAARDDVAAMIEREVQAAEELKAAKTRQDEALKARKATEKPHAAELKALGATLSDSAGAVGKAHREATQALLKLVGALRDHNASVSSVHARLAALGLPLGDEDATYDTGAGSSGTLRLAGTDWGPVPADTLLQYATAEVAKAEFGPKHPAARVADPRIHSLQRGMGGALTERLKVA